MLDKNALNSRNENTKFNAFVELVDTLINRKGFGSKKRPTHILHNFKTRFSRYGQNIKAWVNVDMGTGRISDCFCTDQYNQPINVDKTDIKLG